jgi:superoxide dismutase, Fe-Mn family
VNETYRALERLAGARAGEEGNHGQGTIPLLAIDAWEHAYYLQYLNAKGDFFEAVWQVVNWADVAERLAAARRLDT